LYIDGVLFILKVVQAAPVDNQAMQQMEERVLFLLDVILQVKHGRCSVDKQICCIHEQLPICQKKADPPGAACLSIGAVADRRCKGAF
jgi:hypothetical protein